MPDNLDLLICAATEMELQTFGEIRAAGGEESFLTGVGIPMALAQTLAVAGRLRPRRILNIGIAGAYPGSGLSIGDVVSGVSEVYGDIGMELADAQGFQHVRTMPWGMAYAEPLPLSIFPEFRARHTGRGCTVNSCTGTEATGQLRRSLNESEFETMEGAAVAQAGQILSIPVCEIRAISNMAARRDMRPENIQLALQNLRTYFQSCVPTCWENHHDPN